MQRINFVKRIRIWLGLFIAGLVLSGVSAFPLHTELGVAVRVLQNSAIRPAAGASGLLPWIERVNAAVASTDRSYPFLAYGTDWLAFAHLVIAIAFIGPFFDPVRNKWVITFGLIACAGVIPLAMIAGAVRGIPIGWRLIDCSFGIFGAIPLLICRRAIAAVERRWAEGNESQIFLSPANSQASPFIDFE
ncbi:MAG TPA: hypothetical protein VGR47_14260 [Terracidiphilus sp.]|nr:hypothetical protein [Terracidiphilus sp.]